MPDAIIFIVGTIIFLMVAFGLAFTVIEVRRLDREATDRQVTRSRDKIAG